MKRTRNDVYRKKTKKKEEEEEGGGVGKGVDSIDPFTVSTTM